ncbi:tyrosine phosphatase-like protein [Ordospora pajunii]|uniref:tyrosine phosphatase-like protein n=1 Tax=Ordospora pajunii TaxID=3039483 RepID=UPI002952918D|nr:tyrosine phosphatase-like protein [Ordospora pajunii]KAH9411341.1 tyrosine phosphatase-like protein [Ordospora pajunii]
MITSSYIKAYNMLGLLVSMFSLLAGLRFYATMNTSYLKAMGILQSFFIMEIANICTKKSNARYLPTVMQVVSQLLMIWIVFWYYKIINWSFPVIISCWCLSNMIRYIFYIFRTHTIGIIRYNLFLLTSPTGFFLEMYCLKMLYDSSGRVISYAVAMSALAYAPGFMFIFSHMLRQRRWSKKTRASKHKKKA